MVLSLAEESLRAASSLDSFREDFVGRLRAMARVHEVLASSHWSSIDFRTVADLVIDPYGAERFGLDGPAVALPPGVVSPLCIALHELTTNAVKHGALAAPQGVVSIEWLDGDDGVLSLLWREREGLSVNPGPPGLGLRLVKGFVVYELGGEVDIDFQEAGLTCRLRLPLDELRRNGA
jgi:two-component sensor histidine kinase